LLAALTAGLSLVALKPPDQLALGGKLAVSAYSFAFYLAKTLLPVGLSPLYEMPNEIDPSNPPFLAAYVVAAAVAGVAWRARKRHVALTVALVTFGVVLLPTIGFVQNGPQIAADRYTYHAAPALAILAGGALLVLSQRWALASRLIAAAVVFALGVATWQQTKVWHDSESLSLTGARRSVLNSRSTAAGTSSSGGQGPTSGQVSGPFSGLLTVEL
jgi:hypothetical protein